MVSLDILKSDTNIFKSIRAVSARYVVYEDAGENADKSGKLCYMTSKTRSRSNWDALETRMKSDIILGLPLGENKIKFNDEIITIKILQNTDSSDVVDHSYIDYYTTMTLEYHSDTKSREEMFDFLKEYGLHCCKVYYKEIIIKKKMKDKITVFVWDENYWDESHKWTKRCMESISLSGRGDALLDEINHFLSPESEELHRKLGVPYKRNYILYGPPGTGKSSLINSIASELDYQIAIIHFDSSLTDMKFLRAVQTIPEKTILLLEDIDHIFQERKKNDEMKNAISFSGILQVLDGFASQYKLITMITTNFIDVLDKALIRKGRIDKLIELDYADKEQIRHMYERFVPNLKDQFNKFYSLVKNKKLTTSVLQDYLFTNIDCEDITENIKELEKTIEMTTYKDSTKVLYT